MAGRRVLPGIITLVFMLAVVAATTVSGGATALGAVTTLTVLSSEVSVSHGPDAFVPAVDGEILASGDTIRTGDGGRAILTYFEGSTVTIEPATELRIDVAVSQGEGTIVQMTQSVGRTWHVVTRLVAGGSKYEVKTPTGTASVRGTAFTVDTNGASTTIATTEGTVVDRVPDPSDQRRTIDVPVRAGEQHTQQRGQGAGPVQRSPAPDRRVTITLDDENSLVIDTLGRANGIDKDGRRVLQTPGATLERAGGRLVIILPNIPDGLLQAQVRKQAGEVAVRVVVEDRDGVATFEGKAVAAAPGQLRASVQLGAERGGRPDRSPAATPDPARPGGGGGNSGGGNGGNGNGNGNGGNGNGGNGNGGNGNGGQRSGGPSRSPGFLPPTALPRLPSLTAPATPTKGGPSGSPSGRP
ncbi:MAG TPA: FecR family protein [Candidatus Limnocylindria bacterium]|nr:FecR family protein [Candidatus Limnocylindria bacterium]